jgi:hypothetical protein
MALPRITRSLLDGNLERASGSQAINRRILIIGTAEDGPVYEPVNISDLSEAQEIFGRFGQGTLVRAIREAIEAQSASGNAPNISAVRIGEKFANKAYLNLKDASGNTVLSLQALYPGDVYNDIAIIKEGNEIKIYNPKNESWSVFTYDPNPANAWVDVHNTVELADAINADTNLNGMLVAQAIEKEMFFEINVNSSDASIIEYSDNDETVINLSAITTGDLVSGNRYLDGGAQAFVDGDQNNQISSIESVYAISESGVIEVAARGKSKVVLEKQPLDGKFNTNFNTLMSVTTASGTFLNLAKNAQNQIGGEAYLRYKNAEIGTVEAGVNSWTFEAPWGIAHVDSVADAFGSSIGLDPVNDAGVIAKLKSPVGSAFDATKPFKLEWQAAGASAADWNELVLASGEYSLAWSAGQLTLQITDADKQAELHSIADGGKLRISYDSCVNFMNEASTLTQVQAAGSIDTYFLRGKELIFGAALPANIVIRHATITYYELGSTLIIKDASQPSLKLVGNGIQPGPGGAAVGANDVIIGFKYKVSPDMFVLTGAKSLSNGTNGIRLSNNQLYDELVEAYKRLDAHEFDILVVPGAYLDSTKTGYNDVTGLPQEVNAEFHILMDEFLKSYNGEAVGVIGFAPLKGSGINGSVTRVDVAKRVEKLTEVDLTDPLRAANFLNPFANQFIIAVDAEPIFVANGVPYSSTAEAWVAGHLSTLKANESIYINEIPGAIGLRYAYSDKVKDGRTQLDALSDARIIAAVKTNNGVRLTDGPTLAAPGSDYERLTTLWIVKEAMGITRKVAGDYLGRPASLEILQALETRLKEDLSRMVPSYLQNFTFKIKSSPRQRVLGELTIVLVLVPVFEIRNIKVPVTLKADESALAQF